MKSHSLFSLRLLFGGMTTAIRASRSRPVLETLIGAFEIELKEAGVTDWPGVFALASEAASAAGGNGPRLIGLPIYAAARRADWQ
jgi:hypothetical protein